ncbi:MAG: hypothetical protein LBQ38_01225 [Spirochaetaceae bacterium]|jgi:hypothetical protein|nr:hypothetical protein [Spirochaetaceae bacterium]
MLKCGFYEMDITPFLGCGMPGYFHRRPAGEVFDKLYARAWVTGNGKNTVAVAAVDNGGLPRPVIGRIKDRVKTLTGISPEQVLIGCSHIHQGGPDAGGGIDEDEQYLEFITRRVADTIALAAQRLEPSELRFGKGFLDGYSFCRIYNMEGGGLQTNPFGMNTKSSRNEARRAVLGPYRKIDKSVYVVEIRQKGKPAGILVNFTCHCDVVGSETAVSADYPGELRRVLKEHYGHDTAVLFLQGPCGDINHVDAFHVDETKHPKRYLEIGRALAEEAITILGHTEPLKGEEVLAAGRDLPMPLRKPDKKLLAWSEKIIDEIPEDLKALCDFDTGQVDLFFAKKYKAAHESGETVQPVFLQVLKIGDLGIYASPGELFSEYGDELMAKSAFEHTIVAGYSNGLVGYVVTPECYAEGVYEARQTVFEPPGGAAMNAELLSLGEGLKQR